MIKVSKSFVLFLLLIICTFTFIPNNVVLGASENYFDINTTKFSSLPSASDLTIDNIKSILLETNNSFDLTNYNTIITWYYNDNFFIDLYNDSVFDKSKFYYGTNGGGLAKTKGIMIAKSDITFPKKNYTIKFTKQSDSSYLRTVSSSLSNMSESNYYDNFKNNPYVINVQEDSRYDSNYFYTNFDIIDKNTGVNLKTADIGVEKDAEIGDPSSRLKLSYEYNEDYTECKINATLENGAFTDKIFYSNYMPSIAGQGLLSKKGFPTSGITVTENQSLFFQAEDKDRQYISY